MIFDDPKLGIPAEDIAAMDVDMDKHIEAYARSMREVESFFGCPYCGTSREEGDYRGCCGESSAHFETMYFFVDNGDEATKEQFDAYEKEVNK